MSAPPRSAVMLPRLTSVVAAPDGVAAGSTPAAAESRRTTREVRVGPGGGQLLSNALCLALVELPTAVCAHLGVGYGATILTKWLGLARAIVAIARHANEERPPRGAGREARLELDRVASVPEGDLVQELVAGLESIAWPDWVPRVGYAMPLGNDIAAGVDRNSPPDPPAGISCPLLAARVVSAIRGRVFMRDAAPALSHLLNLRGAASPSGAWEVWLPVPPGAVRPRLQPSASTSDFEP